MANQGNYLESRSKTTKKQTIRNNKIWRINPADPTPK